MAKEFPLSKKEYLERISTFQSSAENYMKENLHPQWKKNENVYRLIHENKALTTDVRYRHRSKLYIPKARNALTRKLAAFIGTYFSSPDVISLMPRRKNNQGLSAAAALLFAVTNYRLKHTLNFFLNCLFAWLDIMKYGRGCICVGWDYEEESETVEEATPMKDDLGVTEEVKVIKAEKVRVLKDEPTMRHVPIWNLFVAPSANPIDPINSSPCLVEKMPVFVHDAMAKWKSGAWKRPEAIDPEKPEEAQEVLDKYRWKPSEFEQSINAEKIEEALKKPWRQIEVWKCFVNVSGRDVFFLTLKGEFMLTDPEGVEEKWPCKGRPYVMGGVTPDSTLAYWASFLEVVEPLQREINAIRNQRRDNITLALNKKLLVRRTAGIDTNSLLFSRPGAPILGDDIGDMAVRELNYQDVTSSSYKEQQLNEAAFEETTGITPYNMGTQRPGMNQTATGTSILTEEANTINAMELRIINETFVIPVLEMVVQFEQEFENEETMRHVAEEQGIDFDVVWTREAIEAKYDIEVNAGIGSTSREIRLRNLGMMFDRAMAVNTQYAAPVMNLIQFVKDGMPLAGFDNPDKYFNANVLAAVMSKFGQMQGAAMADPMTPQPALLGAGNAGGSQVESMQGYGGDTQIYRQ
jgi:hypothetical protein